MEWNDGRKKGGLSGGEIDIIERAEGEEGARSKGVITNVRRGRRDLFIL